MIRHVVLITWVPDTTEEQKKQFTDELAGLPPLMKGLRSYKFGADLGVNQGNADLAIVADFDDVAAYVAYRDHPAHIDIVQRVLNPIAEQRRAVQFEL